MSIFAPDRTTPRVLPKRWKTITGILLLVLSTSACGNDGERPIVPDVNAQRPVSPELSTNADPGGTTTLDPGSAIAPATSASTAPPSTAPPLLDIVHMASDGDDGLRGDRPGSAVRSLDRALDVLAPGGTIRLEPGTYPPLELVGLNQTADAPLRLVGQSGVKVQDEDYTSGAGLLIQNSSHIEVTGIQVKRSLWGVYIQNSHHIGLFNNEIGDVGQEGIRVKEGSSHVVIDGNTVSDTGQRADQDPNGEGIYIGTGSPGGVDIVSNITITNNNILRTTDEAIDIKRPSTDINIVGNTISDVVTKTSGALVIYLNNNDGSDPRITVERNTITNVSRSSPHRDGNCIVVQATVQIIDNVLEQCQHRGIYLRGASGTATVSGNTLIDAGEIGAIVDEGLGISVIGENNVNESGEAVQVTGA